MKSFAPESCTADEKTFYFPSFVIENIRVPVGMKSFAHVGILIGMCAVEHEQPVCIIGKMRRHPIEYHSNSGLVKCIDKHRKFFRFTETTGRGKKTGALVSPASVIWMLHHRHQFNMGEAHILHVIH